MVDISMLSDYGDIYILLSETNERDGPNPCYEFGSDLYLIFVEFTNFLYYFQPQLLAIGIKQHQGFDERRV